MLQIRTKQGIILMGRELTLGKYYQVKYWKKVQEVRLIKVTKSGYNFFVDSRSRCLLSRPIYPTKDTRGRNQMTFMLTEYLNNNIREILD